MMSDAGKWAPKKVEMPLYQIQKTEREGEILGAQLGTEESEMSPDIQVEISHRQLDTQPYRESVKKENENIIWVWARLLWLHCLNHQSLKKKWHRIKEATTATMDNKIKNPAETFQKQTWKKEINMTLDTLPRRIWTQGTKPDAREITLPELLISDTNEK